MTGSEKVMSSASSSAREGPVEEELAPAEEDDEEVPAGLALSETHESSEG